jgi:hypothetical protein
MLTVPRLQSILAYLGAGETLRLAAQATFRRVLAVTVLAAIGTAFVVIGAGFGAWGLFEILARSLGAPGAALIIAAILLLLALILLFIAWRLMSARSAARRQVASSPAQGGLPFSPEEIELVLKLLREQVKDDPLASTLLGVIAGFVTGTVFRR